MGFVRCCPIAPTESSHLTASQCQVSRWYRNRPWAVPSPTTAPYYYTVEPLYNGQVGAGAFVRYSEVSFIGRFHHNNAYLTPYMVKDC